MLKTLNLQISFCYVCKFCLPQIFYILIIQVQECIRPLVIVKKAIAC